MRENNQPTPRDRAQTIFERAGHQGFVEDFMEQGVDEQKFTSMSIEEQELWVEIVEKDPSWLDQPILFDE